MLWHIVAVYSYLSQRIKQNKTIYISRNNTKCGKRKSWRDVCVWRFLAGWDETTECVPAHFGVLWLALIAHRNQRLCADNSRSQYVRVVQPSRSRALVDDYGSCTLTALSAGAGRSHLLHFHPSTHMIWITMSLTTTTWLAVPRSLQGCLGGGDWFRFIVTDMHCSNE